jgi:hypothetical protein
VTIRMSNLIPSFFLFCLHLGCCYRLQGIALNDFRLLVEICFFDDCVALTARIVYVRDSFRLFVCSMNECTMCV